MNCFISIILLPILLIVGPNKIASQPAESKEDPKSYDYVPLVLPPQNKALAHALMKQQRQYAESIRMLMRIPANKSKDAKVAPFTLLPSPFPRSLFDQAWTTQSAMHLLYFRASLDHEFLRETLKDVIETEPEIRMQWEIVDKIHKEGGDRQPIGIYVQRCDYMGHTTKDAKGNEKYELKQVEVNNGAVGGLAIAKLVTKFHRNALTTQALDASLEKLRDNAADAAIAQTIYYAWLKFGDPEAIMLNVMGDQWKDPEGKYEKPFNHERELDQVTGGKLKYIRIGLEDCADRLHLDPTDFSLRLDDGRKVGIVNFRGGKGHLTTSVVSEKGQQGALIIARSTAIKMPSLAFDLLSLKKVQQALAMPTVVERFFPDPEEAHYVKSIRQVFAGLWGLEKNDIDTKAVILDAVAHPEKFVMKPMKEGGGHNIFGEKIAEKLHQFSHAERSAHILMQRLQPMVVQNFKVSATDEEPQFGSMTAELGVYGCFIGNSREKSVQFDKVGGYQMRTKWADSDEGGIFKGHGFYDTPYLY